MHQPDNFSLDYSCSFSFTKADAHLYAHLYALLHTNIPEYENLRELILKYRPLVDYVDNLDKDVHGLTILVS